MRPRLDVRERLLEAGVLRPARPTRGDGLTSFPPLEGPRLELDPAGRRAAARALANPTPLWATDNPLADALEQRERGRRAP
ncbi:MAG: hypothetical protein IT377_27805 [Polyangiaceae bacterium]|nr:hypothetical protein [Polyangiaceae bacterium]